MKKFADAGEPPVAIPVVVVHVDVHVTLVIPPVERGEMCEGSSKAPPLECSQG